MTAHATLAPSAAHRWFHCPGSVALCDPIPDDSSVHAREGTFAHELAARCLKSGLQAETMIGETDGEFVCDADMAEHIQTYIDAVLEVPTLRGTMQWVEERVTLHGLRDDIWGTADALTLAPGHVLHVFDLKFGAGVFVDVVENPQLMIYALAALLTFADEFKKVSRVVIHVIQPRHHRGGDLTWEITRAELEAWGRDILVPAANQTETSHELAAGPWCQFCRAKVICPQLKRQALSHARELFADVDTMVPAKTPPAPESLTPADLAVCLRGFEVIEQWMKAVRAHAYDLVAKGGEIPGHKMVEKTGNRKWDDPEQAREYLELLGVDPNQDPKLVSPAQAEKRLGKARKKLVEQLCHKPRTGTVLVPEEDARPRINAADVFDDGN